MTISLQLIKDCFNGIKTVGKNITYGKKVGDICNIMEDSPTILTKGKNLIVSIFTSAVKPIAKTVLTDIAEARFVVRDSKNAFSEALEVANSKNFNNAKKVLSTSASVYKNGIRPHMAGIGGLVGTFVPLPLAQPAGYAVGKILQILV